MFRRLHGAGGLLRALLLLGLIMTGIQVGAAGAIAQATPEIQGMPLSQDAIKALIAVFDDEAVIGGQTAPRFSKFVNSNAFVFLQFDSSNPEEATALRYIGVGVKSVFCAETQPDPSFTHFHTYDAAAYAEGHGTNPGDQGYWMTWAAVDPFEARDGRQVMPGVDYEFSPTPPSACGSSVPEPDFSPPQADELTPEEIEELAALFNDPVLTGGQEAPRISKWTTEQNFIFLQFNDRDPAEATALPYVGIGVKGVFCAEERLSEDFTHYHRVVAPEYAEGHAGEPGESEGYWLLWLATDTFEARDGRQIKPGVDREFSPTPPPACGGTPVASPVAAASSALAVTATEWRFEPADLHVSAGDHVALTVTNGGEELHTLTFPELEADTGTLQPGETTILHVETPSGPGSYEFICTFAGHEEAGMIGEMVVE